ncbi:2'-5'-oligoadenylate synthase 1A-like [Patiria miniata]|uniref:2'-5'-oligoadenylate synthetase 1 domain-containing protein n=1 Tax=Patiria miniata TaxID=46514 RepID=A0A914BMF8_PATMI|nr:2'-5'-oligoadenylate synthase 1A-like [Patiria miniata]
MNFVQVFSDVIFQGGSLGKDTMLADYSDVDLVAFVNPPDLEPISEYWSPRDYKNQLKTVIKEFEDSLFELPSVTIIRSNEYLVNFAVKVGKRTVSVDLLPTANNDHPDVYSEMMNQTSSHQERGFYSASFVEKQRDFVIDQPDDVRNLIRMVKYWAYTRLPKRLQKSYPLELITIYCWEKAGEPESFEIVEGLKAVLEVLESQPWKRRKFWTDYYSKDFALDIIKTLGMKYPVMLDPANPTNNVLTVYQQGDNMKKIQNAARTTLQTPLLCDAYSLLT